MIHLRFLAAYCTQSHRGILSCGLLVLRDCIYTCNFGCGHAIFPTHWFLSMYVGIAAWNKCTVTVYFAWFMIMWFDWTEKEIEFITLTGMADVYNLYTVDICAYIWCTSDSLKWWDLFSRRSYERLALILINSAHSDRHRHAVRVIHGRYDASVISRSIVHPESPWDLVLWSPGATGLHIHVQLWLLPCYFPNTLVSVDVCSYRSMKQVMRDNLYFGHFASFMIMLFDCTGNTIRCITLTGMADVYIYILLIFVHISGVLQIAWSDETCFHDGLMSF